MAIPEMRPATEDDLELVFRIKRAAFRPYIEATWGWDDAEQRRLHGSWFRPEATRILLAGSEPVGSLHVARKRDEIVLVSVYILPAWQSQGIGGGIVRDLIAEAAARGVPVRLRVLKSNPRARAFYERHGFVVAGETETHHQMRYVWRRGGRQSDP
jgi:ribosomal protein S18 acetylase RimI-like enzyme